MDLPLSIWFCKGTEEGMSLEALAEEPEKCICKDKESNKCWHGGECDAREAEVTWKK